MGVIIQKVIYFYYQLNHCVVQWRFEIVVLTLKRKSPQPLKNPSAIDNSSVQDKYLILSSTIRTYQLDMKHISN